MSNFHLVAQELETGDLLEISDAMENNPETNIPEIVTQNLTIGSYAKVLETNQNSGDHVHIKMDYYGHVFDMTFPVKEELFILDSNV